MSKYKPSMNMLLLLLLLALVGAYYFYIFTPIGVRIAKLNAENAVDTSIINMLKPFEKDDSVLRNRRDQLLKELDENDISKKVIGASGLADEIRAASNLSGIKVSEIAVEKPDVSQKQAESNSAYYLSNVPFSIKFTSDYNSGKKFIAYFENNQKANVLLENVNISESDKGYDFTIKFVLNYYGK